MKKLLLIFILFCLMFLVGCKSEEENVDIYASIYPVYFITDEIVQDKLVVKQIYPTGADVHEYDPGNGKEMVSMSKAKLMFYIGSGLEGFIEKSKNVFDKQDIKLIELSNSLKMCKQTADGFEYLTQEEMKSTSKVADTHVWLDPLRMAKMSEVVLEEVIKIDPENEQFYTDNANALIQKFIDLDNLFISKINSEPYDKVIMVDHDSYLYWEERYGIERIRTRVDNESCDTIISNVEEIINKAKERKIKHIVTTKNETACSFIKKYVDELEAEVVEFNHLSTLYKADADNDEDYFSIMEDNLYLLTKIMPKKAI